MTKKRKPEPQLRELPSSSSFTTPHSQCRAGALYFLRILEQETILIEDAVEEAGGSEEALIRIYANGALERQALSEAVQVFACMALESAVNLLGVMALDPEQFIREMEKGPLRDKLATLLDAVTADHPDGDAELIQIAMRLAEARNDFVHPKPREGLPAPRSHTRRPDLRSARGAIADMERFLQLLTRRSSRYAVFFFRI